MTDNERSLVEGCLSGKQVFHKKLYDTYSPKMFAVCMRYAQDEEQAKDMLQESFIRVFQYLQKFKGEGSFEGWIRRITVNICLELLRKDKKWSLNSELDEEFHEASLVTFNLNQFDKNFILKEIQHLPPGYRAVLNLYIIEGYQHLEIAEILGISENTSKSQLSRARKVLQHSLSKSFNIKNEGR